MMFPIPGPGSAARRSSLLDGLPVYYKLENVSDSVGSLNLTNHGGVTFSAGKVNNAANFVAASSQYLSHADAAAFQMGTGNFSMAVWVKTASSVDNSFFVGYGASGSSGYGIFLKNNGGGPAANAFIADGVNNYHSASLLPINDNNWHLVIATFDRSGSCITYVDNSLDTSGVITGVNLSVNNANGLAIGARYDPQDFLTGSTDEFGLANRIWTPAERSDIWNGGAGTTYPF